MRWPLRYQILFPFAGLFLAVIVLITAVNAYWAARASEKQTEEQLKTIAQTLQGSWYPLTDAVLRETSGLSGTQFAVTSADGTITAASFPFERLKLRGSPNTSWRQVRLADRQSIDGETYFHAALRLNKRGDQSEPGLLHILYPERVWREARWQAIYPPLAIGLFSLVAVGALALVIAARLSQPIQNLKEKVQQLATGDFQAVPLPAKNDELRDLIDSVNQLAHQLDEMRRVMKRTERLSLLGQLSGGLAHHLRNDVTGARMAIQLLDESTSSEDAEAISVALRQLTLAEQHLQQFLAAGQPRPPQRARCDLREVIESVTSLVKPMCKHHRIDLQVDCDEDVHSLSSFEADAEQLRQAILNLVLNAIEAAGRDGWVRIEARRTAPQTVALRIVDNGPGVSRELIEHLFEPFTTSKPEGVGLGLTVARQIAEAHGGELKYTHSDATCFEILLPTQGLDSQERQFPLHASTPSRFSETEQIS